jgi:hypothetical protein
MKKIVPNAVVKVMIGNEVNTIGIVMVTVSADVMMMIGVFIFF